MKQRSEQSEIEADVLRGHIGFFSTGKKGMAATVSGVIEKQGLTD